MKKLSLYIIILVIFISCQSSDNVKNENSNKEVKQEKAIKQIDTLKKIDEVKLTLLDARYEKAELLLGKPNLKGRIMMGHFYYAFYFDKVKSKWGHKVSLLLLIDGNNGLSDRSPIYRIHPVGEGQTVYGAGNNFQEVTFSNGKLTSNSMDFTCVDGGTDWNNVF
ncbi:hypothetical protein [Pedobacter helvus]|uniref:Lipoprotein n=1 Tax=Pedobacter helvus TaxID=2563444 RepID=A0ABW9JCI3_9SPHI|nr:hypothetical protein [Pedobacter ureilyticus]